jgi:acyl carrier protein
MSALISNIEEIANPLCTFLRDNVLASSVDISPETDLSTIGVDSFSLMEMILFIERRFNLVLPAESLTPDNLASVKTLSQYCLTLLNKTDV